MNRPYNPDNEPAVYPLAAFRARFPQVTNLEVAQRCGVSLKLAERWNVAGYVPLFVADLIACRFGTHPGLVWPDLYWTDNSHSEEEERVA